MPHFIWLLRSLDDNRTHVYNQYTYNNTYKNEHDGTLTLEKLQRVLLLRGWFKPCAFW
jgi:hypothetical protein